MSEEIKQELAVYDDIAIRHNAAYAAYQSIFTAKNPKPVLATVKNDVVGIALGIALAVVMIASVIVSSSRTIDEFGGGVIGGIAFVMIEGGIMAYAFFRARRTINIKKVENALKFATIGLVLTFIVGLGANIDATLRHKGVHLPDWVNTGINLLVAVSAPALAFISSDVLAIELMAGDVRRRQADKEHQEATRAWADALNAAWAREKSRWGMRIEIEQPRQLEAEIDVNLRKNTSIDRPSPKLKLALEWLREHPEHLSTESRKLGQLMGVSHATANKAQHLVKAEIDND